MHVIKKTYDELEEVRRKNDVLMTFLNRLISSDKKKVFLYPVNTDLVKDYLNIIKNPMDFTTMKNKILNYQYKNFEDFENDVYLIINNCYTYNSQLSIYYKFANNLENYYKNTRAKMYKKYMDIHLMYNKQDRKILLNGEIGELNTKETKKKEINKRENIRKGKIGRPRKYPEKKKNIFNLNDIAENKNISFYNPSQGQPIIHTPNINCLPSQINNINQYSNHSINQEMNLNKKPEVNNTLDDLMELEDLLVIQKKLIELGFPLQGEYSLLNETLFKPYEEKENGQGKFKDNTKNNNSNNNNNKNNNKNSNNNNTNKNKEQINPTCNYANLDKAYYNLFFKENLTKDLKKMEDDYLADWKKSMKHYSKEKEEQTQINEKIKKQQEEKKRKKINEFSLNDYHNNLSKSRSLNDNQSNNSSCSEDSTNRIYRDMINYFVEKKNVKNEVITYNTGNIHLCMEPYNYKQSVLNFIGQSNYDAFVKIFPNITTILDDINRHDVYYGPFNDLRLFGYDTADFENFNKNIKYNDKYLMGIGDYHIKKIFDLENSNQNKNQNKETSIKETHIRNLNENEHKYDWTNNIRHSIYKEQEESDCTSSSNSNSSDESKINLDEFRQLYNYYLKEFKKRKEQQQQQQQQEKKIYFNNYWKKQHNYS